MLRKGIEKYNNAEATDSRYGVDGVTGKYITSQDDINLHHIVPKKYGGSNDCSNLLVVTFATHKLIHANNPDKIIKWLEKADVKLKDLPALNYYRKKAHTKPISQMFYKRYEVRKDIEKQKENIKKAA